jgi:hypothetical protein
MAKNTASGAWAEVTGWEHCPGAKCPLLFTLTPVGAVLPFQWTPEQLDAGFRVAKLSSNDLHTGDQQAGEAVNALIGLIKEGRQTGGDDPDIAWSSDMTAAHSKVQRLALTPVVRRYSRRFISMQVLS